MDRAEKQAEIESLKGVFASAGAVIVTHNMGLTVAEMTDLRLKLRAQGASFKVVKNTLAQKALAGAESEAMSSLFTGPVAIAFAPDPVSAAKVTSDFAKDNEKLVIVGGAMGANLLDQKGVASLAKLPSLDQLRANFLGLLQTPATRIAGVVQAPAGQIARVIGAYARKEAA